MATRQSKIVKIELSIRELDSLIEALEIAIRKPYTGDFSERADFSYLKMKINNWRKK